MQCAGPSSYEHLRFWDLILRDTLGAVPLDYRHTEVLYRWAARPRVHVHTDLQALQGGGNYGPLRYRTLLDLLLRCS